MANQNLDGDDELLLSCSSTSLQLRACSSDDLPVVSCETHSVSSAVCTAGQQFIDQDDDLSQHPSTATSSNVSRPPLASVTVIMICDGGNDCRADGEASSSRCDDGEDCNSNDVDDEASSLRLAPDRACKQPYYLQFRRQTIIQVSLASSWSTRDVA